MLHMLERVSERTILFVTLTGSTCMCIGDKVEASCLLLHNTLKSSYHSAIVHVVGWDSSAGLSHSRVTMHPESFTFCSKQILA